MTIAAQIATLHDSIKEIKNEYLSYRKKYFNDNIDPFLAADKRAKKSSLLDSSSKFLRIF